jgi:hypothetical protein
VWYRDTTPVALTKALQPTSVLAMGYLVQTRNANLVLLVHFPLILLLLVTQQKMHQKSVVPTCIQLLIRVVFAETTRCLRMDYSSFVVDQGDIQRGALLVSPAMNPQSRHLGCLMSPKRKDTLRTLEKSFATIIRNM